MQTRIPAPVEPANREHPGAPKTAQGQQFEADVMGAKALGAGTVQRKGRVEWSALGADKDKAAIKKKVDKARIARIAEKKAARDIWLPKHADDKHDYTAEDETYNAAMEAARAKYGLDMLKIKNKFKLNDKEFVTGDQYYGAESNGVWKRPEGKEYVKDSNGVFISKYVRRELNQFDLPIVDSKKPLVPTGCSQHTKKVKGVKGVNGAADIEGNRAYGDVTKDGQPLNFNDREFLQQSFGGGKNQFAFSHTTTKHPILSNDHKNFGLPGKPEDKNAAHGRIVTDLSKIPKAERRAQWTLAPEDEGGHKVRRKESDFDEQWMHPRRKKIIASGYRNMEVITANVPSASVAAKQKGWEADDPSGENRSMAGQWFDEQSKPQGNGVRNSLMGGVATGLLGTLALGFGLPAVAIAGAGALAGFGLGRLFGGNG